MSDNAYSLLAGWLRYQRDIGVDSLVFGHLSAVGEILAGGRRLRSYKVPADGGGVAGSHPPKAKAGEKPPVGGTTALSKLAAKMKPVDELDAGMLERRRPAALRPPAPINSGRRERLAGLYREVMGCEKCPMSSSRAKVVFGAGSADGRLFVLGDAPSADDDGAGLPFQGEAGVLLDSILGKMKVDRKSGIFAAYLQKCKSADTEFVRGCAEVCRSILDRQIAIIEPRAILVFGESAAGVLLGDDRGGIERMRLGNHSYMGAPLVATYGLPLMVNDTSLRRGAWRDMERVLSIING
ncbi:MAG: uracil-DNA glycosylase [Chitinispirillales bacterium]|jgi:DNA polymerase|nr:uracil-DNA glycosylase [Chitinispirillales bacterium]